VTVGDLRLPDAEASGDDRIERSNYEMAFHNLGIQRVLTPGTAA